jgi:hypothetical protein
VPRQYQHRVLLWGVVGALIMRAALILVGVALLEQAEWLATQDRLDEAAPPAREARETFERLRAQPRLDRLERLDAALGSPAAKASAS